MEVYVKCKRKSRKIIQKFFFILFYINLSELFFIYEYNFLKLLIWFLDIPIEESS